jgi:methylmalonyl-CoA/ethylmalonyl-CoA epimerase
MEQGKLRHIAISVPDVEEAAAFYEAAFGLKRETESPISIRLSDGTVNLTLLDFPTDGDAGDERGKDFVGLHHIGVWVDDLRAAGERITKAGGTFKSMEDAEIPIENAEHKYRDPNGVVIDVSTRGWHGARRDV